MLYIYSDLGGNAGQRRNTTQKSIHFTCKIKILLAYLEKLLYLCADITKREIRYIDLFIGRLDGVYVNKPKTQVGFLPAFLTYLPQINLRVQFLHTMVLNC